MRIGDYFDAINQTITITRPPNSGFGYVASIPFAEEKQGGVLQSHIGHGVTPASALRDLAISISGKTLVFNYGQTNEKSFDVPELVGGG